MLSRLTRVARSSQVALYGRPFSALAKSRLDAHDTFIRRHIGPTSKADIDKMLKVVGYKTVDELIDKTVPAQIKRPELKMKPPRGENELLAEFKAMMSKNKVFRSHIGTGYYDCIVPPVILRNILENPGWYTPYTPYQAEVAQGRLEMLLNFQTMITDLTGVPVANASLLDEGTAAAEAMNLCFNTGNRDSQKTFLVSSDVHPQTIAVVETRAAGIGVTIKVVPHGEFKFSDDVCGALVQYPATNGRLYDYKGITEQAHKNGAKIVVATDLLALTQLTPPGEWGADVVLGSAQRFGVPMGFGGPHAAFFAVQEQHKRKMPGRVIGVSRDSRGLPALRMAMQTREQHIRRDKATSNICTAQALLANMAAAYAIYHGPHGLKEIGAKVHAAARIFAAGAKQLGLTVVSQDFFDTVNVKVPAGEADKFIAACEAKSINIRKADNKNLYVSFDETTTARHLNELFEVFGGVVRKPVTFDAASLEATTNLDIPAAYKRTSSFLTHPVFHLYQSETEMLRYLYKLQMRDLSLATAMIPLGSCTMKLNATSEMIPVTWPEVGGLHPFAPTNQTRGYAEMLKGLHDDLCEVTGFHSVSLQPNAGSQGEYAGLLAIKAYQKSRNAAHRNICLIPTSAHGTNPATAAMLGYDIVVVKCDDKGNVDLPDLKAKAVEHKEKLSSLMITYPSTHGVFEESIKDICGIIHDNGGQVYMDGANLNAQLGLCSPGHIGADVCHLNLHKTFCIPHGGGGPGMGPIGVAKHLAPFLPGHPLVKMGGSSGAVCSAPYGSASILPISWMYSRLMGGTGLTLATKFAIFNANYMMKRLSPHYPVLYSGKHGHCAHEFILDIRPIKNKCGISEEDIAKRLIDFNFHAPTMSFPVPGTLMIEPTESESLYELDRFCDAMITIREEIREVETGKADAKNNVLKNAPHTADTVLSDKWNRPYPREKAAYPAEYLRSNKFWASVGRLDNVYGDRNLICTCPPLEDYARS